MSHARVSDYYLYYLGTLSSAPASCGVGSKRESQRYSAQRHVLPIGTKELPSAAILLSCTPCRFSAVDLAPNTQHRTPSTEGRSGRGQSVVGVAVRSRASRWALKRSRDAYLAEPATPQMISIHRIGWLEQLRAVPLLWRTATPETKRSGCINPCKSYGK